MYSEISKIHPGPWRTGSVLGRFCVTDSELVTAAWHGALCRRCLTAVPLAHDEQTWNRVIAACKYVPVAYTPAWVRYQLGYLTAFSDQAIDLSCALLREREPVAVMSAAIPTPQRRVVDARFE